MKATTTTRMMTFKEVSVGWLACSLSPGAPKERPFKDAKRPMLQIK